jgi:peptidoglycan/LPS O-acetylase OafA/YrhL
MPAPSHKANSFDALRLAAALMVVLGHAFILSGRGAEEPLVRFTRIAGFGELGVSIFFVISGFLVTASFERLGKPAPYMGHRLLRIVPALAVATVLTALVLGPLVTTLPAGAYFAQAQTWLYAPRNVLLYPVTYDLPGVFAANPYPSAVNGSLWTLRLEFTFYLIPPLLAGMRLLRRPVLAVVALAALGLFLGVSRFGLGMAYPILLIAVRNLYLFAAGAALYAWRDVLRPEKGTTLLASAAMFAVGALASGVLATAILPMLTAGLALRTVRGVSGPMPFGDLSYGIYIYAFPVQQALMHAFGPGMGVPAFLAATLAAVVPLAAASWWLVERPALALKRRIDRDPSSPAAAEAAARP